MGEPAADLGSLGLGDVGNITFLDFMHLCPFIPKITLFLRCF